MPPRPCGWLSPDRYGRPHVGRATAPVGAVDLPRHVHLAAPAAVLVLLLVPRIVTWYSPWMGRYGYVIVAVASAIVIADLVVGRHSLLARVFSWAPLVYVGRISYGLYLYHLPVYFLVERHLPHLPFPARLGLKLALSLGLAALSFRLIERPCLRLKARFEAAAPSAPRRAEA